MRHFRECPQCEASGCLILWCLCLGAFLSAAVNERNWAGMAAISCFLIYAFVRCYNAINECIRRRNES